MPTLRAPRPEDAESWFDFLIAQQVRAYAGIVPADFASRQSTFKAEWLEELAKKFADPGTATRLIAEVDGALVAIASVTDGPASWEVHEGYVPSPAGRILSRLYLAPSVQGTGLASAMFEAVDDGSDLYLWIIDGNIRGQRFYRRRGFEDLPERFQAGDSWGQVPMHRMARLAEPQSW